MYGVVYITLGNLSGNCIAFGVYILEAASIDESHQSLARGLAVICMTAACLLHAVWRQGGIYAIIIMAIFKVCILLAIIVIGFAALGGKSFGYGSVHGQTIVNDAAQTGPGNLGLHTSFAHATKDFASYANSILFVLYTFSGNEQPFYVRSRFRFIRLPILTTLSGAQRGETPQENIRESYDKRGIASHSTLHAGPYRIREHALSLKSQYLDDADGWLAWRCLI